MEIKDKLTTCNGSKATVTLPLGEYERLKAKSVVSCKKIDEAVEERTKELEIFLANLHKEKAYQKEKIEVMQQSLKNCHDVIDKRNKELGLIKSWLTFYTIMFFSALSVIVVLIW